MMNLKRNGSSTQPDRLKLIISVDEDDPITISMEAITYESILNQVSLLLTKNDEHRKEHSRVKIADCQISYRTATQNQERLLVEPLVIPKTKLITLHIRVLTELYMRECLELEQYLDNLLAQKKKYLEMHHRQVVKREQRDKSSQMVKMTVLCGAPMYIDNHNNLIEKTANCLETLKILYEVAKMSDKAINLESMEFNKKTWRDSMDSKILYIIAHAQDEQQSNQVKGETKWGSMELLTAADQPKVTEPTIQLLILQTTSVKFAEECARAQPSKNIIIINHNVLFEDCTVSVFVQQLMSRLFSRESLKDAYESALQKVENLLDDSNKLFCCCMHEHGQKCTSPKPPHLYTNYHYKLHVIRCKCQRRFEMLHNAECKQAKNIYSKEQVGSLYSLCCCAKLHENRQTHSIRNKFQLRTFKEYKLQLTRGKCKHSQVVEKAIKHCLDKMYHRATEYAKAKLAEILEYKNESHMKNKDRFIINLYGQKAAGKTYIIEMAQTIFELKGAATGRKIEYRFDRQEQPNDKDILVLQNIEDRKKFNEIIVNCKRETIIFIETEQKFEDSRHPIKHIEMKNLQPNDAYKLIIQLISRKSTCDKSSRKLNDEQKKQLKRRLDTLDPKYLFPKTMKEEAKKIQSYPNIQEYLKTNLKPSSNMSKQLLQLYDQSKQQFDCLVILSQWDHLALQKCISLLKVSEETFNRMIHTGILILKDDHLEVAAAYRVNLQETQEKYMKQPYGYLVQQLRRHIYHFYRSKEIEPKDEVLFGISQRNSNSPLQVFFRKPYWAETSSYIYLQVQDIFHFLKKNFHSVMASQLKMPIRAELLCQQLYSICILTISLKIDEADDCMLPIIKNINHQAEKPHQLMLSILLSLMQMQFSVYTIIDGKKTNNTEYTINDTIQNIDEKIAKLQLLMYHSENIEFFTAVQFEMLVIESLRSTAMDPNVVRNCDRIRIRMKKYESYASQLPARYEGTIYYKQKKEFLRVLLCRNQMMRFDRQHKIRQNGSEFNIVYQLLQDMLRQKDKLETDYDDKQLLQNIAFHQQLQEKYERVLQLKLQNHTRIFINNFKINVIEKKLREFLSSRDIFTIMISYPIGTSTEQMKLGLYIDYRMDQKIQKLNTKQQDNKVIMERKPLTAENLKKVLRRGSRFIGICFEYVSQKADCIYLEDSKDGKPRKVEELAASLPAEMKYVNKDNCVIFVCGNAMLGRAISAKGYTKTVNIDFGPIPTFGDSKVGFIVERNSLQAHIVNLFVANRDKKIDEISKELELKDIQITNMKEMIRKCQIFQRLQLKTAQSTIQNLQRQPQLRTIRSLEYSQPTNFEWIERWDMKVYKFQLYSVMKELQEAPDKSLFVNQCECFVGMIKSVYSRNNSFPDGIQIVDWSKFNQSEPTRFLDSQLDVKLPILLRQKALIVMKNPGQIFTSKQDTSLLQLMLHDTDNKASILWCSTENKSEFNRLGKISSNKKFRILKYNNRQEGRDKSDDLLHYGFYKWVDEVLCQCRRNMKK